MLDRVMPNRYNWEIVSSRIALSSADCERKFQRNISLAALYIGEDYEKQMENHPYGFDVVGVATCGNGSHFCSCIIR